jgi:hypothetical protein
MTGLQNINKTSIGWNLKERRMNILIYPDVFKIVSVCYLASIAGPCLPAKLQGFITGDFGRFH